MANIPTTWSFSRWQTHQQCPLKYKLQFVEKVPFKQSPAMARGDKVHKGIAAFLSGAAPAMPAEVDKPFHQQLILEIKDNHPNCMVEQQWGFSKRWQPTGWMSREVWLRGIADVAVVYGDGSTEVLDWKTGKKYASNDDQMELFALTVMAKFHEDASRVTTRLVYLDADAEEFAEFDRKNFGALREKWTARAERMLSDREFFARPNDKCRRCDFSRSNGGVCRYG